MLYFTELNTTKEDRHIKKYYPCSNTQDICIISLYSTIEYRYIFCYSFNIWFQGDVQTIKVREILCGIIFSILFK